ncbi:hypothetical protein [Pontivivens ytuae]|uniref:17 kDa surface antigen n=1 Tax=Pontivivens ytuae TaxID=2789856 RepID=A0A7S9QBC9_9RHOB|nr:hypothetical protein [Pontivivens ytuae]QPH52550.1 hypothetical protein I0K15_12050 [Pontivivens ytuae]
MLKTILIGATAALTLAACSPNRTGSESVVSSRDVGLRSTVERCRVLEVREVTIRDEQEAGISAGVGGLAGGGIGAALGNQVGGGSGNELATGLGILAGVVAGGALGEQLDDARGTRTGLEYSVIDQRGQEVVLVQEFLPGDRVAQAGETCRIQVASNGRARVLPGEQLPGAVNAPAQTVVIR